MKVVLKTYSLYNEVQWVIQYIPVITAYNYNKINSVNNYLNLKEKFSTNQFSDWIPGLRLIKRIWLENYYNNCRTKGLVFEYE